MEIVHATKPIVRSTPYYIALLKMADVWSAYSISIEFVSHDLLPKMKLFKSTQAKKQKKKKNESEIEASHNLKFFATLFPFQAIRFSNQPSRRLLPIDITTYTISNHQRNNKAL